MDAAGGQGPSINQLAAATTGRYGHARNNQDMRAAVFGKGGGIADHGNREARRLHHAAETVAAGRRDAGGYILLIVLAPYIDRKAVGSTGHQPHARLGAQCYGLRGVGNENVGALVHADEQEPRLAVSRKALKVRNGKAFVFVVRGDKAFEAPLSVGAQLGDMVEVKDGIRAGDRVVTNPPDSLRNGSRIKSGQS